MPNRKHYNKSQALRALASIQQKLQKLFLDGYITEGSFLKQHKAIREQYNKVKRG